MKLRKVLIVFVLVFILFSMFGEKFNDFVEANPIIPPKLWMPTEHIEASITSANGMVEARVNGSYGFLKIDPYEEIENITMDYPVHPNADKISVKMNGTLIDWTLTDKNYQTVVGDFPMINWTVKPEQNGSWFKGFTINTYYEHAVPLIDGKYMFLYAMGTGRYLQYNPKETTAYVKISVSKDVASSERYIDVYTIGYNASTGEWTWTPADYNITQEGQSWIITLTVVSDYLKPLEEDLLLTFTQPPPAPVGGKATPIVVSVNKLELLAPYIGLTILLAVAVMTVVYVKKRKREKTIEDPVKLCYCKIPLYLFREQAKYM